MPSPAIRYADALPRTADLVVVGGGIVGAATAFFAARAGLRVAVLERRPQLASLTTPASTGAFRLQFDNREELALVREGVELFSSFGERTGLDGWDLRMRRQGYLFASFTEASAERARRLVERQHHWGLADVELLSGDEARARFPYLSPDVIQARYRAGDGWLEPRRLALGYAVAASNPERIPDSTPGGSATFCTRTDAAAFLMGEGGGVAGVATDAGSISAPLTVIATGPFTAELAARAGVSLAINPTRRQKLVMPDVPEVPPDGPMTIDDETAAHWRPAMHGCFALWTDAEAPASSPVDDVPTDARWAFGLLDPSSDHSLARLAPFWRAVWERGSSDWYLQAGQYEYTPDHRPYLGPSSVPGLAINGGYSGHGIMASAAGSRLVVDVLVGQSDGVETAFRVDRPMRDREKDVL